MRTVTEKNLSLIDIDILIQECLKANRKELNFVYLISPWLSDYPLTDSLIDYTSNIFDISDLDNFSDLLCYYKQNGGNLKIICRPINDDLFNGKKSFMINRKRLLQKLSISGTEIRTNDPLHAKVTISSIAVLHGSFNLTPSGRFFNLEFGSFCTKQEDIGFYSETLKWTENLYNNSKKMGKVI